MSIATKREWFPEILAVSAAQVPALRICNAAWRSELFFSARVVPRVRGQRLRVFYPGELLA